MSLVASITLGAMLLFGSCICSAEDNPPAQPGQVVINGTYYLGGKSYEFSVSREQVLKTPDWSQKVQNPPLSPRQALVASDAELKQLLPDAANWRLDSITIQPLAIPDKWNYIIEYRCQYGPLHHMQTMSIYVLMDGTAVKPVIGITPNDGHLYQ